MTLYLMLLGLEDSPTNLFVSSFSKQDCQRLRGFSCQFAVRSSFRNDAYICVRGMLWCSLCTSLSFYSFFLRLKFFLMHLRYIPNSFMKTYQWIHKHSEWLKLQCPTWVIWWPSQNVSSVNHLVKMLEDDHVKYRNGYCINTK